MSFDQKAVKGPARRFTHLNPSRVSKDALNPAQCGFIAIAPTDTFASTDPFANWLRRCALDRMPATHAQEDGAAR
jgi:hypothetical protein